MLEGSSNNSISGNSIANNRGGGIHLYWSSNNSLVSNEVTNNGGGIYLLYDSYNNVLRGNNITGNGLNFGFWFAYPRILVNDIDTSNLVEGKPIYYLVNQENLVINPSTFPNVGYLALINSTNIIIENLTLRSNQQGLLLMYTNNSLILSNNITSNSIGIQLIGFNNTIINNNVINDPQGGLYGIQLWGRVSHNNNITGNNVIGFSTGISLFGVHNNTIANNIIKNNYHNGISLHGSNNTIVGNSIIKNEVGFERHVSSDNIIYHNNLIDNTKQVSDRGPPSIDVWDAGYPSGGNYWSDYTGVDEKSGPNQDQPGSDGIGDTPYVIDENNTDRYPLMWPYGDITAPTTTDDYDGLWHTQDFTITLTATDDLSGVAETYYRVNNGPIQNVSAHGYPFITTESANNTLEYWSIDKADNEEFPHNFVTGIKLDKTAPTGSIIINNGDTYATSTSVTLTLTATDATSGVYNVRFSNDGVWDGEPWEPLSATMTWTLTSGDGSKTVYFQVKDNAGLVSETYSDTIVLDTTPPTGSITVNAGAAYTNTTSVTITLSADDATSGVSQMRLSNDGATWSDWEPYAISKSWTLSTGDETKTVYVQFMDNAGLTSQYQDTIIFDTTPPVADAGANQTVVEDTLVTFNGSASTDENGIASYTWSFIDITPQTLSGKNPTYTFTTPGTYTITLTVTDPAGNTATDTVTITVLDITKPTANAGSDRTVNEDTSITLDGSASSDNVGITAYTWTFTDVTTKTLTGAKPTYTFNTPGVYTITLNVTDAAGNWATETVIITVLDITKPVANAGTDQTVNVDETITFDASASSDNVGIVSYEWDFGDGTTGTGKTTTKTYATAGTYTVTLTIKDAAGNTATHQITITVEAPPAEGFPMWVAGAVVAVIAIATAGIAVFWRRRK